MTTQGQKTPFQGKKTPFFPFFEEKLDFFGAGGPEKLVARLLIDEKHAVLSPSPSKWGRGGLQVTTQGQKTPFQGKKTPFFAFF